VGDNPQGSNGVSRPQQTGVEVTVYDVLGRRVKNIYKGRMFGGVKNFEWDGTNENNSPVTSGVYFLRTNAGSAAEVRKIVLVR
jgi:flagellar hook assembly protein FlgD